MSHSELSNDQSDNGTVSQRVVMAVADACDTDPLELPQLYDVIDTDALDTIFGQGGAGGERGLGRIIFLFNGCEVVVHSDGTVDVTAPGYQSQVSSTTDTVGEQEHTQLQNEKTKIGE